MDRGYNDYALFGRWTEAGVFFVTRLKDDAAIEVVDAAQAAAERAIIRDQIIRLTGDTGATRLPASPAPRAGLGRRQRAGDRSAHQPARLRRDHHRRHLQGALADRAVLQGPQAESEGEDLRRHQRKRAAHSDLDSPDRDAAAEVAAPPVAGQLVVVQSGLAAAAEPLYLSRLGPLAQRSARHAATAAGSPNNSASPGAELDRLRQTKTETTTQETQFHARKSPRFNTTRYRSVLFWTAQILLMALDIHVARVPVPVLHRGLRTPVGPNAELGVTIPFRNLPLAERRARGFEWSWSDLESWPGR